MSKVLAIAALVATALGGWLYGGMNLGDCMGRVETLEASYEDRPGGFGYGEMTSGLKNAASYCKAGDEDAAAGVLAYLARSCHDQGGCA